jgi:hypothetical protein
LAAQVRVCVVLVCEFSKYSVTSDRCCFQMPLYPRPPVCAVRLRLRAAIVAA